MICRSLIYPRIIFYQVIRYPGLNSRYIEPRLPFSDWLNKSIIFFLTSLRIADYYSGSLASQHRCYHSKPSIMLLKSAKIVYYP